MHYDNALAAYRNRLRAMMDGDKYTSDRYFEMMRYFSRKHAEEVGVPIHTVTHSIIDQAQAFIDERFPQ